MLVGLLQPGQVRVRTWGVENDNNIRLLINRQLERRRAVASINGQCCVANRHRAGGTVVALAELVVAVALRPCGQGLQAGGRPADKGTRSVRRSGPSLPDARALCALELWMQGSAHFLGVASAVTKLMHMPGPCSPTPHESLPCTCRWQ